MTVVFLLSFCLQNPSVNLMASRPKFTTKLVITSSSAKSFCKMTETSSTNKSIDVCFGLWQDNFSMGYLVFKDWEINLHG